MRRVVQTAELHGVEPATMKDNVAATAARDAHKGIALWGGQFRPRDGLVTPPGSAVELALLTAITAVALRWR